MEILKLSNGREVSFTRINNDVNGNPRYVCHYLDILTKDFVQSVPEINGIDEAYEIAVKRAKAFGGKKYIGKSYGGGIVFQSYNLNELKPLFEQPYEAEYEFCIRKSRPATEEEKKPVVDCLLNNYNYNLREIKRRNRTKFVKLLRKSKEV